MRDEALPEWPAYMSTPTAARYLDVPEATLIAWRNQAVGPKPIKVGKRLVRYSRAELDDFIRRSAGQTLGEPTRREMADA